MTRKTRTYVTVKCNDNLFHTLIRTNEKVIDLYTKKEVEVSPSKLRFLA